MTDAPAARPIRGLRWWITGMICLVTIINYTDRQTLWGRASGP